MAKIDYLSLYKRSQKFDGTQKQFCETRRPKLSYVAFKKGVSRLRKQGKIEKKVKVPKTEKVTKKAAKKGKPRARAQNLTHRQQKLMEQELSTQGKTHAQMAKDAGYNAKNLSKAFITAREGQVYQETLARSRADLRRILGIPGVQIMIRLAEIGFSRPGDILEVNNGEVTVRTDIDFSEGADLAIGSLSVKMVETETVTRKEIQFVASDCQAALRSLAKFGGYFDDSTFNSLAGGDDEVIKLWGQFKSREITAVDLSTELAMRGLEVPKFVMLQAKAELNREYGKSSDDLDNIDLMDFYDEMLEDEAIAKKKFEVEAERKKELEQREIDLEELNREEDLVSHAEEPDNV